MPVPQSNPTIFTFNSVIGWSLVMSKSKSIIIAVVALLGIFAILFLIKFSQIFSMVQAGKSFVPPPEAVGSFTAEMQEWPNTFTAMGTVEADEGINISAEVAGKVQKILFKSGERVKAGTVILVQESGNETAQIDFEGLGLPRRGTNTNVTDVNGGANDGRLITSTTNQQYGTVRGGSWTTASDSRSPLYLNIGTTPTIQETERGFRATCVF